MNDPIPCAYGENAWQAPAQLVPDGGTDPLGLGRFEHLEGSAPSYNNWAELDRQLQTVTHVAAAFDVAGLPVPAIALGTKHGNACGAAVGATAREAIERMVVGDPRAIFGGCVLLTTPVDADAADALLSHGTGGGRRLLDLVTAPSFTPEAVEALARKHGKCRLLANPALASLDRSSLDAEPRQRPVRGGVLEQPNYTFVLDLSAAEVSGELTDAARADLLLAFAVGSTSNSNTVTLVRDGQLLGNGVGQQDRVGGATLAVMRARDAGHDPAGAVAYSDSFFPFPDGPQVLTDAGVTTIFSTTGSVRDDEVRAAIAAAGAVHVGLPDRDARGFFGH
jgi:phosphoribosylaminoimidazolecarboxamide formyltransferase / IMP cyclohydrolase